MSERNPVTAKPACPICGKPTNPEHRPFCSARCRTIDLGRWLKGEYRIPTNEGPEEVPRGDGEDVEP
jgi:endogenous inhibitor of DNA gyrase (YacG/DUF329 family)